MLRRTNGPACLDFSYAGRARARPLAALGVGVRRRLAAVDHHPPADVVIDEGLIRGLLERQLPQFAGLPLWPAAHGWDNEMWRLGADLVVRLPRRREAAQLLRHEVRWLPVLARQLPVSIPTPVAGGVPDDTYPYPWAVLPWLPGHPASSLAPSQRDAYAGEFGQALRALHRVAPSDAPINPFRGGDLRTRRSAVADRLAGLEHADELLAMVDDAIAARAWAGEPRWLHGDPPVQHHGR